MDHEFCNSLSDAEDTECLCWKRIDLQLENLLNSSRILSLDSPDFIIYNNGIVKLPLKLIRIENINNDGDDNNYNGNKIHLKSTLMEVTLSAAFFCK